MAVVALAFSGSEPTPSIALTQFLLGLLGGILAAAIGGVAGLFLQSRLARKIALRIRAEEAEEEALRDIARRVASAKDFLWRNAGAWASKSLDWAGAITRAARHREDFQAGWTREWGFRIHNWSIVVGISDVSMHLAILEGTLRSIGDGTASRDDAYEDAVRAHDSLRGLEKEIKARLLGRRAEARRRSVHLPGLPEDRESRQELPRDRS